MLKTMFLIVISVIVFVLAVLFVVMIIKDEKQIKRFKNDVDRKYGGDFDWDQML